MVMNIGGHFEAKGLLTKNKHTGHLPQDDQVGGFPTNTLIAKDPPGEGYLGGRPPDRGGPPGRGYPGGESPGGGYPAGGPPDGGGPPGPLEDKDPQALKDQQDM